jgi:hypothetical protein
MTACRPTSLAVMLWGWWLGILAFALERNLGKCAARRLLHVRNLGLADMGLALSGAILVVNFFPAPLNIRRAAALGRQG